MIDLSVAEISRQLADHAEDLCRELLPNGRKDGGEWRCGSINGEAGGSLGVHLVGAKAGTWTDFAGPDGNGGDLVDLIEKVKRLDKGGAVKWAKDRLGIGHGFGLPDKPVARAPDRADDAKPVLPIPKSAGKAPHHPKHGKPTQRYAYRDHNGEVLFIACRIDPDGPKALPLSFWTTPDGKGEWRWKALPTPRPLFGLYELAKRPDAPALLVEGEKSARAAQSLFPDYVAVTWPGGTSGVASADWTPFAGRDITIWPDNDEPGRKAAQVVAECCHKVGAATVKSVAIPENEFPSKWDLANSLPAGWDHERLVGLLEAAVDIAAVPANDPEPKEPADEIETEVIRLADYKESAYELKRKDAAKKLGVRTTFLDKKVTEARKTNDEADKAVIFPEIEPWPDPVDGAKLLDDLTRHFCRFLSLADHAAEAMALWVIHTYCLDVFMISPRLAFTSPLPRCGKSTALYVLRQLVMKSLPADNITAASLFRAVEKWRPTILVDEADTFLKDNDELRGILNSGHLRGGFVLRTVGDDHEPRPFSTWGAVAIAKIGRLPATLEDRSVIIPMRRKMRTETTEKLRLGKPYGERGLAAKCARWAADNTAKIGNCDPAIPASLHDRAADNWRPLLSIADLAGGDWSTVARQAAIALSGKEVDDGVVGAMLLVDIKDAFDTHGTDKLSSQQLVDHLVSMENRPWSEWRNSHPMTKVQLARQLKPFGVTSGTIRLESGGWAKGYPQIAFKDLFSRYTPSRNVTPSQPTATAGFGENRNVTSPEDVTFRNRPNSKATAGCDGVTDRNPPGGDNTLFEGEGDAEERAAIQEIDS